MKIFRSLQINWVLTAALAAVAVGAAAQEPEAALQPSIRVTSEAAVSAKPDQVQLDIGVTTRAPQSEAAATQNAQQLESVLRALRKVLGAGADVKTISYSLQPNYHYPPQGGQPTIEGYTASNVVRITLDDLARIGKVIDAATGAGANQVQRLQFKLKDEQAVRTQALREAAVKARSQADALAAALGVKITRILSAVESTPIVYPVHDVMLARAEAAATPIEPGTIEMRATVTLTVEIAQP